MTDGPFYIGISGGHSRSVAVAANTKNEVVGCVESQSLNQHTYSDREVSIHLRGLLDKLAKRIGVPRNDLPKRTDRAVLSIAGAATEEDRALVEICLLRNGWPRSASNYEIVDDTWAGLVAGTLSYTGTCAFAGTGASVYVGRCREFTGKPNKIDGWGPIIGDFGSGFQLAADVFRFFGRYFDRHQTAPPLFEQVLKIEPHIGSIANCQRWFDTIYNVYPDDWRIRFACLAAAATVAADAIPADPDATRLVLAGANDMIESIKLALARWSDARSLPIVFQGGMFEHSKLYRETVELAVRELTTGSVGLSRLRPTMGALVMALFPGGRDPDRAAVDQIENSIPALPTEERSMLVR